MKQLRLLIATLDMSTKAKKSLCSLHSDCYFLKEPIRQLEISIACIYAAIFVYPITPLLSKSMKIDE